MHSADSEENVELVRRGFQAFSARDMATLTELFHPDARWRTAPLGVIGGEHSGRDAVFAMFANLGAQTKNTFTVTPTTYAGFADTVFVRATAGARRGERQAQWDEVLVFRLDGGKVREVSLFLRDYPTVAEFWQ
ncbi:MAG: nuclear transport factor 2 family protein [Candidatus Eremiobacteraeota bacterium]|nr:nuclear transport factor 2 family protein [Candidatus Eremiobacteraeota bacterium]